MPTLIAAIRIPIPREAQPFILALGVVVLFVVLLVFSWQAAGRFRLWALPVLSALWAARIARWLLVSLLHGGELYPRFLVLELIGDLALAWATILFWGKRGLDPLRIAAVAAIYAVAGLSGYAFLGRCVWCVVVLGSLALALRFIKPRVVAAPLGITGGALVAHLASAAVTAYFDSVAGLGVSPASLAFALLWGMIVSTGAVFWLRRRGLDA